MPTYRIPHTIPLARRSRRRPVFGRGEDAGRYYRCWNCGFVCDSKRDSLGGSNSAGGDNHYDYALQAGASYRAGLGPRPVGTLDVLRDYQVALRIKIHHGETVTSVESTPDYLSFGSDPVTFGTEQLYFSSDTVTTVATAGIPESVYHHYKTNITAGCPFCGCTNYRGDY